MPAGFGPAAIFGLIFGFMFGIGCSLAVMYSIFLGGYRAAIKDSMTEPRPARYVRALKKLREREAQKPTASGSISA